MSVTQGREVLLRGGTVIDGELTPPPAASIEHRDPSTGEVQATVSIADHATVDRAVRSAAEAGRTWRATPPEERRDALLAWADLIESRGDDLRSIAARENGTPIALADPRRTTRWIRHYAGYADKLEGRLVATAVGHDYVVPTPYGVVGAIVPFNGPMATVAMKAGPALAAGNTVVVKPSELAPFSSVVLAELAVEAGLPAGALNVVQGDATTAEALVRHRLVRKVSFTGGTQTGRRVMEAAAAGPKPVALELGGKSPLIVFPDADLDATVPFACSFGLVMLSGQNCQRTSLILVHEQVYAEVRDRLVAATEGIRLGPALDWDTEMGPVISAAAADRVVEAVRSATQAGGRLLAGGQRADGALAGGYFVPPTVIDGLEPSHPLAQQEVFGPVVTVHPFRDEAEALGIANGTDFGLAAHVHTRDLARAHRMAGRLEAGSIHVNGFSGVPTGAPFGGFKDSGFGREGGPWGLEEFLQQKNVYVDLSSGAAESGARR